MIWIDPHISSFTFKPVAYYIKGISSLPQKHDYLSVALRKDNVNHFYFTNQISSIPKNRFLKKISKTLFKFLVKLEIKFWIYLNKIKKYEIHDQLKGDVFFFGFQYLDWDQVEKMVKNPLITKIFIHLNHYHTFSDKKNDFSEKIYFCCDFDVSSTVFFKSKYPKYKNPIIEVPFYIQDRFFAPNINHKRDIDITIVGSYILFDKDKDDVGIYTFDKKYSTIHPIRHALSQHTFKHNVLNNQKEVINGLKGHKKYYSNFDMVELMAKSDCIICGSEGNGILGISTLEGLAMGCAVFIHKEDLKILNIEKFGGVNLFENMNDLFLQIDKYDSKNQPVINRQKLREFARKYQKSNVIDRVRTNLNCND